MSVIDIIIMNTLVHQTKITDVKHYVKIMKEVILTHVQRSTSQSSFGFK